MLKIVAESKLAEEAFYKTINYIPSSSPFSYTPFDYCETFGYNVATLSHLKKTYEHTKYLKQLIDILYAIYNTDVTQDVENYEEYYLLSKKEKKGLYTICYGKKIFEKLLEIEYSPFITPELLYLINKKNSLKEKLSGNYKPYFKYDNYTILDPAEIDIYTFLEVDIEVLILPIIQQSITSHEYFTNTGKTYISLDTIKYLYLAGDRKGKIKNYPDFKYFADNNSKEMWDSINADFDSFLTELKQIIFSFRALNINTEINKGPTFVEPVKEKMFAELSKRDEYKDIKKVFNEVDDYFIPLFNLGYITYLNNTLQLIHPLRQNAFPRWNESYRL